MEGTGIMFPIPLDFVPLFPAFPSPGAAAPAPGALSESLERGGRGQESCGRGCDPLTTQAKANLPTCVSPGPVARLLVAACATSPCREQRRCHICFFPGEFGAAEGWLSKRAQLGGSHPYLHVGVGLHPKTSVSWLWLGLLESSPVLFVPPPLLPWASYWGTASKETCPVFPLEGF